MILLRLISWPYLRKHLLRSLLTVAGIALGVAVFVGMHTANQSVAYAFRQTVDRVAGKTQLQVTAGEPGFAEEVLDRVQNVPGVRVAAPVIEAVVQPGIPNAGTLLVLAVDMTGDRSLRDYEIEEGDEAVIEDPLVFLARADSLIITDLFATRHGLKANDRIRIETAAGPREFTVRGIMRSGGLTSAFGGNLAVMDVYAAQKVFGRGRRFDRIDIGVEDELGPAEVATRLQAALGPGFTIEEPGARGQQFESLSQVYAMSANITSLFALFIGLFIIYNTFSTAVSQRRKEIAVLRALGAKAGQIRTLFLAESATIGLIGSAIGIALGVALAGAFAGSLGSMMEDIYGVAQRADSIAADPRLLITALVLGLITSLLAAWVPARTAARLDPAQGLQKGRIAQISAGESRARKWLAAVCAASAMLCLSAGAGDARWFYAGYMLTVTAAVLIVPALATLLARWLRPLLRVVRPVEGTLAVDSVIQAPRRIAGTVAALMLSLGLAVSLGGLASASYRSIVNWINSALNPDFFVAGSEKIVKRDYLLPPEMEAQIRAVPGVRVVQPVRSARVPLDGKPVLLIAIPMASVHQTSPLEAVEGNLDEMYARAARGEGVVISDNLAILRGIGKGDVLRLPAPGGEVRVPVTGVVLDHSDQLGSVFIDLNFYRRHWGDDRVTTYRVFAQPAVDKTALRQTILERVGKGQRLFVLTNQELRDYILKLTDQWFGLSFVQIQVAVLVAILGIVKSLTVSIADRRREFGILQAVGGLRWQIRRTVWLEAGTLALIGLALGLVFGAVQLFYSLEITHRYVAGLRLSYIYPLDIALILLPVILIAAFLAALGPGESAVRGSLVEALEYE